MKSSYLKIAGALIFVALVLVSCLRKPSMEKYRESNVLGQETITIDVCLERGAGTQKVSRALDDSWQRMRDIYHRMSNWIEDSDMGRINRSYQSPQTVGADTIEVLQMARRYHKLTNGAFDVTVGSLMALWKRCEKENRLPTEEEIKQAKGLMGLSRVKVLSGHRVELAQKGVRVDYGGIATGYAVDEVAAILRRRGFKNFLIDAAGDMYASGVNCDRKRWKIAVKNPQDPSKMIDIIEVSNASVSTSGDYERFYSIRGEKFSHIINPVTGYPQKGVVSATVIAPSGVDNEAFAKTLCILPPGEGIALINALGKKYAALIISKDQNGRMTILKSARYKDFQIKKHSR